MLGSWEFDQLVYVCFVDLKKAFDHVPSGILWIMGSRAGWSVSV